MTRPTIASLQTVIDSVAVGLVEPQALWRAAVALMRCRRHGEPVEVFDGARGGQCARCIRERYQDEPSVAPAGAE